MVDAFGFAAGGLVFFVGLDVCTVFAVEGYKRGTMFVARHVVIFAVEFAIDVVVAAVRAGRVSGRVRVPAPCVGGVGGDGGARCGLGWSGCGGAAR